MPQFSQSKPPQNATAQSEPAPAAPETAGVAPETIGVSVPATPEPAAPLAPAAPEPAAPPAPAAPEPARPKPSGLVIGDSRLPWPVRRGFRTKAYGLGAIQLWVVFVGMTVFNRVIEGGGFTAKDANRGTGLFGNMIVNITVVIFVLSILSLGLSWKLIKRHPWNYVMSIITTILAVAWWTLVELFLNNPTTDSKGKRYFWCTQMLGITAGTITLQVLVSQIEVPEKYECFSASGALGLCCLICVVLDAVIIRIAGDFPIGVAFLPGCGCLVTLFSLMVATSRLMTEGNPDKFLHVSFFIQTAQFLCIAIPIIIPILIFGNSDGINLSFTKRKNHDDV